ncbi:MAG: hypothetical protein ACJ8BF_06475 [Gemmatimonadales bacterium]
MNRRRLGRSAAALGAVVAFAWAGWAAYASAMPEYRVYDGYRMILGSVIAVALIVPFIWRWRRDRSLVAIAVAAAAGSVLPLALSAVRHHIPLLTRLRGAWFLAGADLVGPALVVGYVCLWLALREWTPPGTASTPRSRKS